MNAPPSDTTETRWIALLRGINVGGNNKVPMADLRAIAGELGYRDCATYIQSGNLLLSSHDDAATIESRLSEAIAARFGFRLTILLRTVDQVRAAYAANPFAAQIDNGKQLHIYFLDGPADRFDEASLRALAKEGEDFSLCGGLFYLFARDGIGRSKLAEQLPRYLPPRHSARNLNTIEAILALTGQS